MGSEKSADQAWDFVSSWFVIFFLFYRAAEGSLQGGHSPPFSAHIDLGVYRVFLESPSNCE